LRLFREERHVRIEAPVEFGEITLGLLELGYRTGSRSGRERRYEIVERGGEGLEGRVSGTAKLRVFGTIVEIAARLLSCGQRST